MNNESDRIIVLKPIDGKPLNTSGMIDKRLFDGKNNFHIKMDKETSLWYCYYEQGLVPPPLQQRFTSFNKAYDFAKNYFLNRDVEIKEVINA